LIKVLVSARAVEKEIRRNKKISKGAIFFIVIVFLSGMDQKQKPVDLTLFLRPQYA
jgi:hypothetical protein